ncbi:MAG: endonuclease/exonuclease/phosphatase family protein [Candidatus Hodarchaeales archaeon]|jgi:endonuclease/exonuclease/phosphatase family metal-dependent hydrolase
MERIRAMTFNIRNSEGDRGTINDWSNRKEKIQIMIHKYKPDIIGMQEVLEDQLEYLINNLTGYQYKGVGRDDGIRGGEFNPIFYRDLEIEDSGTFWLSDTPDVCSKSWSWCNRICTWINFKDPQLSFFNTHLDEKTSTARLKSIPVIINKIEDQSPSRPVILAGDFNFERNSAEYRRITYHLLDAYLEDHDNKEALVTYHGFKGIKEGNRSIDFIFVKNLTVQRTSIINNDTDIDTTTYPSDHWPVIAELSF